MSSPNGSDAGSVIAQRDEIITRALRQTGVRGVIQAGWAGLYVTGDDILTIGDVPHEWLFPQMAAVAHHCGAGTTAAGLRAGIPTIAMPNPVGDQPFWVLKIGATAVSAFAASGIRDVPDSPTISLDWEEIVGTFTYKDGRTKTLTNGFGGTLIRQWRSYPSSLLSGSDIKVGAPPRT